MSALLSEASLPYPRLCAHRGFHTVAPENSLPAYAAAVALGAEEIELDVWSTTDGILVSCHDPTLERVSNGVGKIYEKTYEELLQLDFGSRYSDAFRGLQIPTFEEILRQFAGRAVLNIHVKIWDEKQEDDKLPEILSLLRKYNCENSVYFMTSSDRMHQKLRSAAPKICRCIGWDKNPDPMEMPRRAIRLGAQKVQFFSTCVSRDAIRFAHENGIRCNLFYADDPKKAKQFLEMGIDTILTNDYWRMRRAL